MENLVGLVEEALAEVVGAASVQDLDQIRVNYLGKRQTYRTVEKL